MLSTKAASQQRHHDAFLRATPPHMLVDQATRTGLEASTVISHQDQWVQLRNSFHLIDYLGCVVMRFNFPVLMEGRRLHIPAAPAAEMFTSWLECSWKFVHESVH